MSTAFAVWLLGAALLPLGSRCLCEAACSLTDPAPRAGCFRAFFPKAALLQSGGIPLGLAAACGAAGETSSGQTCGLALSLILLPMALPLGLPAAGAALCVCVALCVSGRERLSLWGRLIGGLGLFILGGVLMRGSGGIRALPRWVSSAADTLYALPLGAVIGFCAAFVLRDAAAPAAWAALLFPGESVLVLCVLFSSALAGEALAPLLLWDHTPGEKRVLSLLVLSRIMSLLPVLIAAALLRGLRIPEGLTARCLCFTLCAAACSLISWPVGRVLLSGEGPREAFWHPYLNRIPPAALYALEKDARRLMNIYRCAAADGTSSGEAEAFSPQVPAALRRGQKELMRRNLTPSQRARGEQLGRQLEALCVCAPLLTRAADETKKPPRRRREEYELQTGAAMEALERAFDQTPRERI